MKRTLLFMTCMLASLTMLAQEYFPEGTKWTEIRLDTLKYDSWYSKVGNEWVPNFETIEYYVKGEYVKTEWDDQNTFKKVYSNGSEWTDSLTLLIQEAEYNGHNSILASVLLHDYDGYRVQWPGEAYQFDWNVGQGLYFEDITMSNTTSMRQPRFYYGIIDEIKKGNFGGVRPLKYVDLDGKAPDDETGLNRNVSTNGGRVIQGIGITEWNDGECLFGPPNPYFALTQEMGQRHYRSMLVHFERNGEVLYDVWPEKEVTYRPMIEDGKVWKVGTISGNPAQVVDYYYFDGDTIINGKTCKQMMCQRYVSPDYSNEYWLPKTSLSKVGAWYEENKKVYVCREGTQGMQMLYDFSLNANDTLILNDYQPDYIVGPKQTGGLNGFKGVYRDIMLCGQDIYITTWLEGVGGIDGPLRNAYPETADPMPEFLMSCTVGDEVIYLNDEYEDGATPETSNVPKQRLDFTHTTKTKPKAPKKRSAEQPLYGEYNDQQLGINLDQLDEAYMVRITDESGKAVYEKSVNAGNIVALSIDISAYPQGRYTVTIENSLESFTGQFHAQTTGIIDAARLNNNEQRIKNKLIYSLQGQRLSRLQKGLNIVNGRKVLVK
ncbi:MAG: DUF3244 domain-containing protein [Prevotella sp.]|nr:DUF3244 domain-containing protein [Prevotella sp.]